MDTEEQRQCRRNDERLTESGSARSKQLLEMPTVLRRIARRALEWIGMSKTQLVFRYEISDLFSRPSHKRQD